MKTLIFDLDNAGAKSKALREVTKLFARNGTQVVSSSVDQKLSRRAGVTFRNVNLTFADNQTVTMAVKSSGDVFEVRLNGKALPLRNQDDHVQAIGEIADRMDASRGAFQRALARTKVALPVGIKVSRPAMFAALTAKRDALVEAVTEAKTILAALQPVS